MRPLLLVVVGVVGFLTVSAFAQNPPATTPVRVAGTIEKLDGDNLTIKTKEGQAVTVTLNADAAIFGVVPVLAYVAGDRALLKPGAAVVTVAQKKPDSTLTTGRVTAEKNGVKPPM
jgi:hypothetical protein